MYNYYVLIMSDIYSQVWLNENKYIDRLKKNKIDLSKGELISKCPFGVKTSSKKPRKLFLDFSPDFLQIPGGFLEAFWASWGLSM